jgi:drug/metabolite transporter (DMT)-like permease
MGRSDDPRVSGIHGRENGIFLRPGPPCGGQNVAVLPPTQLSRGVALAAGAALLFGVTAPFLQRASDGVPSLSAGCLLYLGAGIGAAALLGLQRRGPAAGLRRGRSLGRLALVALVGAVVAPVLLVLGLRRVDAATASLLLALEAPLTLLLAWLLLHEHLGRRVLLAAGCILGGGALLALGPWLSQRSGTTATLGGALLIAGACAAWATDNLLSRTLADEDPIGVVAGKGLLGALAAGGLVVALGQPWPGMGRILALLAIGALGFGVSLQLYLRAQTLVGAARTASVFATAPFVGAAVALLIGSPWPGWPFPIAAATMMVGVGLHVFERHAHRHTHEPLEHAHMHRHDDGHHDHRHGDGVPAPDGSHSHWHRHDPVTHEHEHSEDVHHRHTH